MAFSENLDYNLEACKLIYSEEKNWVLTWWFIFSSVKKKEEKEEKSVFQENKKKGK